MVSLPTHKLKGLAACSDSAACLSQNGICKSVHAALALCLYPLAILAASKQHVLCSHCDNLCIIDDAYIDAATVMQALHMRGTSHAASSHSSAC